MSTRRTAQREEAPAQVPALDRTLTWRMHTLHKLTDQESQRLYPEETGLSLSDGRSLSVVGAFGPLSINQLAQLANLNKAQASRSAQYLAEQGLIAKEDTPGDARGVALTLTPRGRKVWQQTMAFIDRRNQAIFGCLSRQEQELLGELFDRLIAHANQPAA